MPLVRHTAGEQHARERLTLPLLTDRILHPETAAAQHRRERHPRLTPARPTIRLEPTGLHGLVSVQNRVDTCRS